MKHFIISGFIADVFNQTFFPGEITINNSRISDIQRKDKDKVDNVYILPGLIDSHIHIESSMLTPGQYSKLAVKHGVTAAIADPHEIANILGIEGIQFMIKNGRKVPFKFFFGAPSCVPATPFEINGAVIDSESINKLISSKDIWFLAEVMNFPGVINKDEEVIKKINFAQHVNKPVDGHAPGLSGNNLLKYIDTGIKTDHECITYQEALEKIKCGMKILIREGSAARNFNNLFPLIDEYSDNVMLCTDDSHPDDLINGYINQLIKKGIDNKLDIFNLLKASNINPIKHYNLPVGSLQVNDPADLILVNNLNDFKVLKTFIDGNRVYDEGKVLFEVPKINPINKFKANQISKSDIIVKSKAKPIRIIEVIDNEIYTKKASYRFKSGIFESNINDDILKIVFVNRYRDAKPQVGFVKNFNLKRGAIAQSISHDSHNILAIGTNDKDLTNTINRLIEIKGGIVVFDGKEYNELPLEIGGIMTNSDGREIAKKYKILNKKIKEMGSNLTAPLMTLSFLALLVIPELKIGYQGLFDFSEFKFVDLYLEE